MEKKPQVLYNGQLFPYFPSISFLVFRNTLNCNPCSAENVVCAPGEVSKTFKNLPC